MQSKRVLADRFRLKTTGAKTLIAAMLYHTRSHGAINQRTHISALYCHVTEICILFEQHCSIFKNLHLIISIQTMSMKVFVKNDFVDFGKILTVQTRKWKSETQNSILISNLPKSCKTF
jgi:hypothetical protein